MGLFYCISTLLTHSLLFILIINVKNTFSSDCKGCVELDNLTFDKLLSKFPYSVVKFDIAFPYGEQHEEYGKFAKAYGTKLFNELLIGIVGIKDYGDKDNSEMGKKYKIKKEFPDVLIFKNTTVYARWPKHLNITYNNMRNFITEHTTLYVGLEGCLKEFDDFAVAFMKADNSKRKKILNAATTVSKKVQGVSQTYILAMEKILQNGNDFISEEINRLKKLLKTKISENKIKEIGHKLNVMKTFGKNVPERDEL